MIDVSHIKGILFDLDGTLVDTYRLIAASQAYATKAVLGKDIPEEVLMSTVGLPLETQMADHCGGDPQVVEELCQVYREHNARVHDQLIEAFPLVNEVLQELSCEGYVLGVVTSKRSEVALRALDLFDMTKFMSCVIGARECPLHKPDPGPVLMGVQRLGLDPSQCAYVGDSPFDIQAANSADCLSVAATWGMFDEEALLKQGPQCVCSTMAEFGTLFSKKR